MLWAEPFHHFRFSHLSNVGIRCTMVILMLVKLVLDEYGKLSLALDAVTDAYADRNYLTSSVV